MATKFTKPIVRELEIADAKGNVASVVVTLAETGVQLRRKGSGGRVITASWADIGSVAKMPENAPVKFYGDALGWLVEPKHATESVAQSPPAS